MAVNPNIIDQKTPEDPIQAGRPRMPLLVGQCLYIERAYSIMGMSQSFIAQKVGVAIPRVRRHLVEKGLYTPRLPHRTIERAAQLDEAAQAYANGDKVVDICQQYSVNPAELYRELRRRDVPFRTKPQVYKHRQQQPLWKGGDNG